MDEQLRPLRGLELRYLITLTIWQAARSMSIADLTARLAASGVHVAGRPSKTISGALRWEVKKGRVRRVGRGRYRTRPDAAVDDVVDAGASRRSCRSNAGRSTRVLSVRGVRVHP